MQDNDKIDKTTSVRYWLDTMGITELLAQEGVTEVMINRPYQILVEGRDGLVSYEKKELTYAACKALAVALATLNDKKIDLKKPLDSVTLPDGERAQIIIPPAMFQDMISICIRKPSKSRFTLGQYDESGRLADFEWVGKVNKENTKREGEFSEADLRQFERELIGHLENKNIMAFFEGAIHHKLNICMVGGTGSGKTTFTKALADLVPANTRIITIEDTHELDLPKHDNKLHLFYKENVTPKQLIEGCMRSKPDRIFLTELRGDEAWDYLTALNTGHPGGLTSVHANDAVAALFRIAQLAKGSEIGRTMDYDFILNTVRSTIDVVCFFEKTKLKEIYYSPILKKMSLAGRG
jgi:type IV secretion system protein VirB11